MSHDASAMNELHWLIDMVQTIEVGLVVLDRNYDIQLWNSFMESHSGISPNQLRGQNLFEFFPDLPKDWLTKKMEMVFTLKNRAFISWEQRPYVFKFKNYRPITGRADVMYQNITLQPLTSLTGEVTHISMLIYDVSDVAVNKLHLKGANEQLEQLSQTDSMTQLYNRRYWQDALSREFERYSRYQETASLVMIDIDFLKNINDIHGHQAGDKVILHISQLLRTSLRKTDFAGRYGGEEFGIVLPNTSAENATVFAERLQQAIAANPVSFQDTQLNITVSLGICALDDSIAHSSDWIRRAVLALYQAKDAGRNCYKIYQSAQF
ncbi:diguanylate cyclase [Shewanella sp. NFH-SH190041]|uniref:sensor domain-containing diguanylate cyclase n=1 Tax=Shewanella sp. NFH-SH190041 TaxID=2950245 RepID=UPI0021C2C23D|nr:diguanylate cyclase [Shewanella sp. NFH-SH190041]BDM65872.1 diguanylate cyclase [Shewanella sp. NFH-SH190041]